MNRTSVATIAGVMHACSPTLNALEGLWSKAIPRNLHQKTRDSWHPSVCFVPEADACFISPEAGSFEVQLQQKTTAEESPNSFRCQAVSLFIPMGVILNIELITILCFLKEG